MLIKNSYDYATHEGYIYKQKFKYSDMYYRAKESLVYGYVYIGINFCDKKISKRIHRIVAETFIPNPNNYSIINHKNDIKHDNRVENLEWCNVSQNTKHTYDNGLSKNDKGYNDSQSKPVVMYDLEGNIIEKFGSMRVASKETNILFSTIHNHCKNKIIPRTHKYYFKYQTKKCND